LPHHTLTHLPPKRAQLSGLSSNRTTEPSACSARRSGSGRLSPPALILNSWYGMAFRLNHASVCSLYLSGLAVTTRIRYPDLNRTRRTCMMWGRVPIARMSSGLNGPSANVPSISNETVPTPSLQPSLEALTEELVELMLFRTNMGSNEYPFDKEMYEPNFRRAASKTLSEIIDRQGVDHAVNFIAKVRVLYLFD